MAGDSTVIKMLKNDYLLIGLSVENTYKKTDMLLRLYRKIDWTLRDKVSDYSIYADENGKILEALCCLLEFAPEKEIEAFHNKAVSALHSKALMDIIETAVVRLRDYPDNGKIYYDIIDMKYLSYTKFDESEILELLNLERSTYYRKKKEATYLVGYILFGFVIPDYINTEKVARMCNLNATEFRQHCD